MQQPIIRKVLSYFRKLAKVSNKSKRQELQRRSKTRQEHIEWIEAVLRKLSGVYYTVEDIRQKFNLKFADEAKLSRETMRRIMKNDLYMRHKKLETCNQRALRSSNIRIFCELMTMQWELINHGFEMIWIDEFTWSHRSNSIYGWCKLGEKRYISLKYNKFKMSFIIAFLQSRFYGISGTENTNDNVIFGKFLLQLWESLKDAEKFDEDRWVLVMDNASIHKTEYIQRIATHKQIRIITIAPYEPSLNSAEKLILSIKSKMTAYSNRGKLMSLASVKSIVNEVATLDLQKMVEASFREALGRMKQLIQ